jgi:hypothetical protein
MKLQVPQRPIAAFAMRSQSRFGRLWKRLADGVVQDVPPSLEECEKCRELECTQERWESCERRLAAEAAALTASSDDLPASTSSDAAPEPSRQEDADSGPDQSETGGGNPEPPSS